MLLPPQASALVRLGKPFHATQEHGKLSGGPCSREPNLCIGHVPAAAKGIDARCGRHAERGGRQVGPRAATERRAGLRTSAITVRKRIARIPLVSIFPGSGLRGARKRLPRRPCYATLKSSVANPQSNPARRPEVGPGRRINGGGGIRALRYRTPTPPESSRGPHLHTKRNEG